jgi:hypothetical protein
MTQKKTNTIVQALPGWELAVHVESGVDESTGYSAYILREPIIAWHAERIEEPSLVRDDEMLVWHRVMPMTFSAPDPSDMGNIWAVKRPDGKLEQGPEGRTFASESDFLAFCEEQRHKKKETKAQKAG